MTDDFKTLTPDARRGAIYGLVAAALFGLSAPIAKHLLAEVRPQVLAGLLYAHPHLPDVHRRHRH
jgi:hypothetical protein